MVPTYFLKPEATWFPTDFCKQFKTSHQLKLQGINKHTAFLVLQAVPTNELHLKAIT